MLNELKKRAAQAAKRQAKKKPTRKKSTETPEIEHRTTMTVAEWCRETGGERHGLMKKLAEMRVAPAGDAKGRAAGAKLYTVGDLYRAMGGGEYEQERIRKTREEADKLELANMRTRGETVEIAAVKKLGERVMVAIRQKILGFQITDDEKDSMLIELMSLKNMDWDREPN
jgi:hypothetical protein